MLMQNVERFSTSRNRGITHIFAVLSYIYFSAADHKRLFLEELNFSLICFAVQNDEWNIELVLHIQLLV